MSGEQAGEVPGSVEAVILNIRGLRVMLAGDLATTYGVSTKRLNELVRRNRARFPGDFVFQLTREEFEAHRAHGAIGADGRLVLRSQIGEG